MEQFSSFRRLFLVVLIYFGREAPCSCVMLDADGGYTNLVVALEPTTSPHNGREILSKLQSLLNRTSYELFVFSKGHFHLESISILVPGTWTDKSLFPGGGSTFETYQGADIRIDGRLYSSFQQELSTRHVRTCGQTGEFIHLTNSFVKKIEKHNLKQPAKLLLKQWVRYRLGTDDTSEEHAGNSNTSNGHKKFSLLTDCNYPPSYYIRNSNCWENNMHSSNQSQDYANNTIPWTSNIKEGTNCEIKKNSSDNLTISTDECKENRIWEEINSGKRRKCLKHYKAPKIRVVKYAKPRFVFVVDRSFENNSATSLTIRNALGKFLAVDFPSSHDMGIVMASNHLNFQVLKTITNDSRENVLFKFITMWENYNVSDVNRSNISSAMTKAVSILNSSDGNEDESSSSGIVILIHASLQLMQDIDTIQALLTLNSNVKLHIVSYLSNGPTISESRKMAEILKTTTISWHFVPANEHVTGMQQCDLEGRFKMEDTLSNIVNYYKPSFYRNNFMIYQSNHHKSHFTIGFQGNILFTVHSCSTNLNSTSIVVDRTSISDRNTENTFQAVVVEQFISKGLHNYTIRYENSNPLLASIWFLWSYSLQQQVDVKCFIDTTTVISYENYTFQPVIIRASVYWSNSQTETDVTIKATITNARGNKTEISLLDSGNGDPDVAKNDGVYSRYFVNFSHQPMFYYVTVTVTRSNDPHKSSVIASDSSSFFTETTSADASRFPPTRIVDLHVDAIDSDNNSVIFSWTAPGNILDSGKASFYIFLCSRFKEELEEKSNYKILTDFQPKISGQREEFLWSDGVKHRLYYCAISSYNSKGKNSARSNIVSVILIDQSTKSDILTKASTKHDIHKSTPSEGDDEIKLGQHILEMVIMWICVAVVILLIIIHHLARTTFCPKDKTDTQTVYRSEDNLYSAAPTRANGLGTSQNLYGEPGDYIQLTEIQSSETDNVVIHAEGSDTHSNDELADNETTNNYSSIEEPFLRQHLTHMTTFATPERRRNRLSQNSTENVYDSLNIPPSSFAEGDEPVETDFMCDDSDSDLPPPPPTPHYAEIHEQEEFDSV